MDSEITVNNIILLFVDAEVEFKCRVFLIYKNQNNVVNCDFAILLYQIVGKLTLILLSPDPFFSFWLYKYLYFLFFYWSIHLISCNSIGFYSLHLDPLIYYAQGLNSLFLIALRTVCLMLLKLEYAVFLTRFGAL